MVTPGPVAKNLYNVGFNCNSHCIVYFQVQIKYYDECYTLFKVVCWRIVYRSLFNNDMALQL